MREFKLQPNETKLIGQWVEAGGKVVADEACQRIQYLVSNHYLIRRAHDKTGWEILYQDKDDGRFWELTYPQSHLHGGGPPTLRCLSKDEAKEKYEFGNSGDTLGTA